jgi:hypothetical protein
MPDYPHGSPIGWQKAAELHSLNVIQSSIRPLLSFLISR